MNSRRIVFGIGIVLALLVLTVSTASAYITIYLDPQDSDVPGYGDTTEVKVMADITGGDNLWLGQFNIQYDQSCCDITDLTWGEHVFPGMSAWNPPGYPECWGYGQDHIRYYFWPEQTGLVEICTFTFQGNSTGYCTTDLTFPYVGGSCKTQVRNATNDELYPWNATLVDGTFECGTPAETYTINGSTPAAVDKVTIENLNNDKKWDAAVGSSSYELELTPGVDVNATETLRIISCDVPDNYTTSCNRTDHVVENCPGVDTVNIDVLDDYCQNYYPTFPFHTWNESNWSGPAAMEMLIDHYPEVEDVPNQTVLNKTAIEEHNLACNADLQFVDPRGMRYTLNDYLYYPYSPYVAHYGIGSSTDINNTLHYMCKWHYLGPGAAPAYGDYSNWMVIRGIHTDVKPSFTQGSYEIKGFWINDPKDPGGIGENAYKSVEQWKGVYHKMLNVNPLDTYNGTYVAVCEPPEDDDVEVTLARPKPRLADAITPVLAEKPLMIYGIEQLALEKVVKDDEMLRIVAAAIDGANEELVPYDAEFTEVFAKTVPGSPMFVASEAGDYYVVPFNVPVELKPIKKVPVAIEKVKMSGLKKLERVKRVDKRIIIKPIAIEPAKIEGTLVVVVVDADDGSFKEASWVGDPVKYLPVSKVEALELALGEIAITDSNELRALGSKPTIELAYRDASPYYPDWKITVNGKAFYVSQDGTVSS